MLFPEILLIAVSLALDAAIVAVGAGALARLSPGQALRIALVFGLAHVLMPLLGFFLGYGVRDYILEYGHIAGGALLLLVGMQMVRESLKEEDTESEKDIARADTLLLLALATSIDVFVVGITFSFIDVNVPLAIGTISVTAFSLALLGTYLGKKGRHLIGNNVELVGALVLILLGLKTLFL